MWDAVGAQAELLRRGIQREDRTAVLLSVASIVTLLAPTGSVPAAPAVPTPSADDARLLTPREAAARLGVSREWLRRNRHRLGPITLSPKTTRYLASRLDDWMTARRQGA